MSVKLYSNFLSKRSFEKIRGVLYAALANFSLKITGLHGKEDPNFPLGGCYLERS